MSATGSPRRCYNRSVVHAHLLPAFGTHRIENLRPARVEQWRNELVDERGLSRRTANKALIVLGAIFERACQAHGLTANPAREIKKLRDRYDHNQYDFYSREEIEALAQAAGFQQDAAIYRTATFTGLRMGEPIALRWSDIDFDSESPHVSPPTAPARSPPRSPGSRAPSRWPSRSPRLSRRCGQAVRAWRATISSSERVHRGVTRMTKSALTAALILTIGTTANAYPFLPRHLTLVRLHGAPALSS